MPLQYISFILFVVVLATTSSLASVYDRCLQVDDNSVVIKLKGGGSIKLVRKGDDIFLHEKHADNWRWLSSIDDREAFRMILKFVKMGKFSGCRRLLFTPKKPPVLKKPRKHFRNAWFF